MIRKSFLVPLFALGLLLPVVRADDAKPTPTTGTITGKVTDSDGKAVSGATVGVYAPPAAKKASGAATIGNSATPLDDTPAPAPAKKKGNPPIATGTTDDSGAYKIENIPAGSYVVRVRSSAGNGNAKVTVAAGETASADITIKPKKAQ